MKTYDKVMNYPLDPDSKALDFLWGLYLVYIPLGLTFPSSKIIGVLFVSQTLVAFTITCVQIFNEFNRFLKYMDQVVEKRSNS